MSFVVMFRDKYIYIYWWLDAASFFEHKPAVDMQYFCFSEMFYKQIFIINVMHNFRIIKSKPLNLPVFQNRHSLDGAVLQTNIGNY